MIAEGWQARTEGPFVFLYHEGSYAHENLDAIVDRFRLALADVCAFLDVDQASLKSMSVYLGEGLEGGHGRNGRGSASGQTVVNMWLDLEAHAVWTIVTSESPMLYPEFELTRLVLYLAQGPGVSEAHFWEDGLAGYLEGKSGSPYFAEAVQRATTMREEGQLRRLVDVVRQYPERRSQAATTMAVAFVIFLIEWRGAERFRRFLAMARHGDADAFTRAYGRPLAGADQMWVRRLETSAQQHGGKTLEAIKGTLPFLRPYRVQLAGIFIASLLGLSFEVFVPLSIRFLLDNVLNQRPLGFSIPTVGPAGTRIDTVAEQQRVLLMLLGVMIFMFLLNAFARIRQTALTAGVSQAVNYDLRMRFLAHLQRLPISYHARTSPNEITQRFNTDIAYVPAALSGGIVPIVQNGLAMLIFGTTLFFLNPWLALMALTGLPVFALARRQGRTSMRDNIREQARRGQEITQALVENAGAQSLLKTWNARPSVLERFREKLQIHRELNVRNMIMNQAFARASALITNAAQVAILIGGGLVVVWTGGEALSAGGLMAFYIYLLRFYTPAGVVASAFQTLSLSADGLERVSAVLNRKSEQDPPDAMEVGPLRGALRFEGATYAQAKGKFLLKNLDLEIPAGSSVAFVGPTGAGKASLMQILPRLYDLTAGRITWDGVDVTGIRRDSIRAQIITLPGDTFVFNLTIYENILLGRPTATEEDVIAAATLVGLHDFVSGLPGGYDTIVNDRDATLSTPLRQALTAARALLRTDASVVLMEDALSAIEASKAREIERALRGPDGSRTLIKVAQRLGGITDADEIFVMEGGEIVERGRHDELLDRGGVYVHLLKDELGEGAVSGARQAVRRLRKLAPFSELPPSVLDETAHLLLYAERRSGEVICRQGSVDDELYIIGRGEVEIVVTDAEGHEQIVNVLDEGDYFGEISFLRRTPRTATVRAKNNVELHVLRRLDFDALMERLGAGTLAHMEKTAQARIDDTREKLAALATGPGES